MTIESNIGDYFRYRIWKSENIQIYNKARSVKLYRSVATLVQYKQSALCVMGVIHHYINYYYLRLLNSRARGWKTIFPLF